VLEKVRRRGSIPSMALAVVGVLALLLAPPVPAWADHKPKHPNESPGSPLVPVEADPDVVAADPGDQDNGADSSETVEDSSETVEDSSKKDRSDKEDKAEQVLDNSTPEGVGSKPKPEKESPPKPKGPKGADANPQGTETGCGNDPCPTPKVGVQPATSPGLVSGAAGGSGVALSSEISASPAQGVRTAFSRAPSTGDREGGAFGGRISLFGGAGIRGGAQPSLAILVDALNDADGDGIYSDSETASQSGADTDFKAIISNTGTTEFEITGVIHSFLEQGARAQVEVCGDLYGLTLGPGESFGCSFSVADYAPPIGKTLVNTVTASAMEVAGSGTRGTSDSDNSTVATLLADQVLAAAIGQASGPLAFTGTDAAVLVALALVLLAAGGSAHFLSRIRGAPPERPAVWIGPRFRVPGVRTVPRRKPLPEEKAVSR
jgi:hypothetical protein